MTLPIDAFLPAVLPDAVHQWGLVALFQAMSGLAWCPVFGCTMAAAWRTARHKARGFDLVFAPLAFMALVQIGFTVRWLLFPGAVHAMQWSELTGWSVLYILSAIVGLWLAHTVRRMRSLGK